MAKTFLTFYSIVLFYYEIVSVASSEFASDNAMDGNATTVFPAKERRRRYVQIKSADEIQSATLMEDNIVQSARILRGNVKLTDREMVIQCDEAIQYSQSKKIRLINKVKILTDSITILSTNGGMYFTEEQLLHLNQDIELRDDSVYARSNELLNYGKEKKSVLMGDVYLKEKKGYTLCDTLYYHKKSGIAKAKQRVLIVRDSGDVLIFGDSLTHNSKTNSNIIYAEKDKRVKLFSLEKRKDEKKKDTLFIFSKILRILEPSTTDTVARLVMKDSVAIMKKALSCASKNATYYTKRKIITMSGNAVIWKDNLQATGDSIAVYLRHDAENSLDKVLLYGNAFIVTKDTLDKKGKRFNQSNGKSAKLLFSDSSQLTRADIVSQAKLVYHIYKGKVARGAAKVTGDTARFNFQNGNLSSFDVIGGVDGEQYPERTVRLEPVRLEGFKNRFAEKPTKPKSIPAQIKSKYHNP